MRRPQKRTMSKRAQWPTPNPELDFQGLQNMPRATLPPQGPTPRYYNDAEQITGNAPPPPGNASYGGEYDPANSISLSGLQNLPPGRVPTPPPPQQMDFAGGETITGDAPIRPSPPGFDMYPPEAAPRSPLQPANAIDLAAMGPGGGLPRVSDISSFARPSATPQAPPQAPPQAGPMEFAGDTIVGTPQPLPPANSVNLAAMQRGGGLPRVSDISSFARPSATPQAPQKRQPSYVDSMPLQAPGQPTSDVTELEGPRSAQGQRMAVAKPTQPSAPQAPAVAQAAPAAPAAPKKRTPSKPAAKAAPTAVAQAAPKKRTPSKPAAKPAPKKPSAPVAAARPAPTPAARPAAPTRRPAPTQAAGPALASARAQTGADSYRPVSKGTPQARPAKRAPAGGGAFKPNLGGMMGGTLTRGVMGNQTPQQFAAGATSPAPAKRPTSIASSGGPLRKRTSMAPL